MSEVAQYGTPEHALLYAIYDASRRFGRGFGNFPWGAKTVIDAMLPHVRLSPDLQKAYLEFDDHYRKWKDK